MAKKTIRDLFVKLGNIFTDFYIINNIYILPGPKSDETTKGYYYSILTGDMVELCREQFNNDSIIFIESVRDTKDDMRKVKFIENEEEKENIYKKLKEYQKNFENDIYNEKITWNDMLFTTEQIDSIFKNSESITMSLYNNKSEETNVVISKTLFPLLTEKTLDGLYYAYIDKYDGGTELHQLLIEFFYEYFQLNMRYLFIPLE